MKYELEYNQLCHYEQKILQLHAERACKKIIQDAMSPLGLEQQGASMVWFALYAVFLYSTIGEVDEKQG